MSAPWSQVRALFERALDVPPTERAAWLAQQAAGDTALHAAVERLLAHEGSATFLVPPSGTTLGVLPGPVLQPGARLGPFVLGDVLGQGGMGVVHRARQDRPQREVAVKVMRSPLDGARLRRRFEAEIEALARLQHPGIAQVFEAGVEADGTCWFAMELLAGAVPLAAHDAVGERPLPARLRTFLAIADAVQHAHQRGVIHRDLKPANILLLPDGGTKVIDFGIARVLQSRADARTDAGMLLGTLAYMSPEQVEGRDVDVRTDVYGLGVVLYELLCGCRPFELDGQPLTAAIRTIVEREPQPPSARRRQVPIELDWIVGKALRKEPAARYASVAEFAADVQRLLHDEPVLAAPPGVLYRARKFVRRHRLAVAAATTVVAVTIAALVTVTSALLRTQQAEAAERTGRTAAERAAARAAAASEFLLDVFSAPDPAKGGREVKMADALLRGAGDLEARFQQQPDLRAALDQTIGQAFFGLGMSNEALQHLRSAVAAWRSVAGGERDLGEALVSLVSVLVKHGDLDEAETVLHEVDALATKLGADELAMAAAVRRADLLRARGDRAGARTLLEPLVARMQGERGPTDRPTLLAANLLAGVLHESGELEAAEVLYRSSLARLVATKGEDHPESLSLLNNLLLVQHSRGGRKELLPTLERLLTARRRLLGDDHPDTIGTLNNVAGVRMMCGDLTAAIAAYREALERLGKREGEKHPAYAAILGNLASTERLAGDFPAAIEHGDKALELRRASAGATADGTLMLMALAADVRRMAGRHAEALPMFEECRRLAAAATPAQPANVYRCDLGIGRVLMALGRLAEAEVALLRCRETFAAAEKSAPAKGQLTPPDQDLADLRKVREGRNAGR
jgi:tetratricopeptide (TPR) repeat protein/tRNA A-37 threonylcarbamoyl transferase component Bud32